MIEKKFTSTKYPSAVNPSKIGSYALHTFSGGGYFYDEVLEYRVWVHSKDGDDYYYAFSEYETALKFSKETYGAEKPLVLVLQQEHINEPQRGKFEHVIGNRITEWEVEWLTKKAKRNENSIREFLQRHNKE